MPARQEIEIKFLVPDLKALEQQLVAMGFRCVTPSTREVNTLYDLPGHKLRRKGELLRLRQYGDAWRLTHKARAKASEYKSRTELETAVADGAQMELLLRALGYQPVLCTKNSVRVERRAGHVVLDHLRLATSLRSKARALDRCHRETPRSRVPSDYVTKSYAELYDWKRRYKREGSEHDLREIGGRAKARQTRSRFNALNH
jgi:adenylate cyclase class 2